MNMKCKGREENKSQEVLLCDFKNLTIIACDIAGKRIEKQIGFAQLIKLKFGF